VHTCENQITCEHTRGEGKEVVGWCILCFVDATWTAQVWVCVSIQFNTYDEGDFYTYGEMVKNIKYKLGH
jgi:hypothetical protein